MRCTLYTYGYTGGRIEDLRAYAAAGALIVDVRLSARSRAPQWRGTALRAALGRRYVGLPSLGNLNYLSGGPISIATPEEGLDDLATLAAESPVVLLCVCANPETCHRATVAQMAQEAGICSEVVHLRPGDPWPGTLPLSTRDQRIAEARLAHVIFPEHCLPDPEDDAAWEMLARRTSEACAAQGIDLDAIGQRAEERVLAQIAEREGGTS